MSLRPQKWGGGLCDRVVAHFRDPRRAALSLVLFLVLLTGFVFAGEYIQKISMIVVEQRGKVVLANGQTVEQWMVTLSKGYTNPGLATMKSRKDAHGVTLWDAIHEIASGDLADTLVAVAIHEGGGTIGATESGGGPGRCAFQITGDATFKYAASKVGVSVATLKANIMNDARMCAAAGYAVLMEKAQTSSKLGYPGGGSPSGPGAICLYGGQIKTDSGETIRYYKGEGQGQTFFTWKQCPAYVEVIALRGAINGKIITGTTENDVTKAIYSYMTFKDSDGNEIGVELTCVDYTETLARALANASKAFRSAAMYNFKDGVSKAINADNTNNTDGQRGTNKEKQCLKYLTSDYFNNIVDILENLDSASLAKFVKGLLKQLVDKIKSMVCSWVAQQINNLLESVCLPIPSSWDFTASLPSLGNSSCSGISLADMFKISSDYGSATSTVSASSLLPIPRPLGLTGWIPPETQAPMARGLMTTTTGTGDNATTSSTPLY